MAFKWKDRENAVSQAAYQFIKFRNWVQGVELTAEESKEREQVCGDFWAAGQTITFDEQKTMLCVVDEVLGTGTKFKSYFCLDPEGEVALARGCGLKHERCAARDSQT
jgi:hypothetical protein